MFYVDWHFMALHDFGTFIIYIALPVSPQGDTEISLELVETRGNKVPNPPITMRQSIMRFHNYKINVSYSQGVFDHLSWITRLYQSLKSYFILHSNYNYFAAIKITNDT